MAMFERRHQPLLPLAAFLRRQLKFTLIALSVILGSLGAGMAGYHFFEGMNWVDSLLNASMILGGMGPVNPMATTAGKVFASIYALYSGVIFLVVAGILFVPGFHRLLHHFHLETDETPSG
ncbi:MAG: hypothetical protein LC131_08725 [Anaerolineae bacterium]|nr:hypothetical protein [Anaerolineae bacterium]